MIELTIKHLLDLQHPPFLNDARALFGNSLEFLIHQRNALSR